MVIGVPNQATKRGTAVPEKFEHYPPTFGPMHIERLARLSEHRGEVEVYTKREDCNSKLAFGGNKQRKLEYIIPNAVTSNADTLVSIDGVQSNHTRMVAAKIGMKCRLMQESWMPHGDAVYDRVGNILLSSFFDRESVAGSGGDGTHIATVMTGRRRDGKSLQSPLRGASL
jgi:1-aminocyclopropane-1-carboxylate deaminase/D-cysteine desulfhydrase-like pyridoxal-dependent ACC family enzyme